MFKVDFRRKHVFVALAVLLALAMGYRFSPALKDFFSPNQQIALMEKRLQKYQEIVDSGKDLNDRLDSLNKKAQDLESRLLEGKTPSLAAVEVQNIMQQAAAKSAVQISSVRVLSDKKLEPYGYILVPVEFQMLPTIRQLKEILYQLEAYHKYLTVEKLVVQEYNKRDRQLRCAITLAGVMKRNEN